MEKKKNSMTIVIALLCALLVVMVVAIVFLLRRPAQGEPPAASGPKIGYATEGVTAVEDPEALQKAVDEMMETPPNAMTLEYRNDATSTDGENFECYIANAVENDYDMFIAIYGDNEMSDELFVSQLLRPGSAFETLKLNHSLEEGTHRVNVAFTQVEEDLETIHAQLVVTMDFHVQ